jgi:hypothetical protein
MFYLNIFDSCYESSEETTILTASKIEIFKIISKVQDNVSLDFPSLPSNRSETILILSVPNIDLFFKNITPKSKLFIIINHLCQSIILIFNSQNEIDIFWILFEGSSFSTDNPSLRCIALYLCSISLSFVSISPKMTIHQNIEIDYEFPSCPICFQLFDQQINSYFSPSLSVDISKSSYQDCKYQHCCICEIVYSESKVFKCGICGETEQNWLCLKCSNIGCSRQLKQYAIVHFKETQHRFCLSLKLFTIWDYIEEIPVNRCFQTVNNVNNENALSNYRFSFAHFLEVNEEEERKGIQVISEKFEEESKTLQNMIEELLREEEGLEIEYQRVIKLEEENKNTSKMLKELKQSPELQKLNLLEKEFQKIQREIRRTDKRISEELKKLDQAEDVSSKVIETKV